MPLPPDLAGCIAEARGLLDRLERQAQLAIDEARKKASEHGAEIETKVTELEDELDKERGETKRLRATLGKRDDEIKRLEDQRDNLEDRSRREAPARQERDAGRGRRSWSRQREAGGRRTETSRSARRGAGGGGGRPRSRSKSIARVPPTQGRGAGDAREQNRERSPLPREPPKKPWQQQARDRDAAAWRSGQQQRDARRDDGAQRDERRRDDGVRQPPEPRRSGGTAPSSAPPPPPPPKPTHAPAPEGGGGEASKSRSRSGSVHLNVRMPHNTAYDGGTVEAEVINRPALNSGEMTVWQAQIQMFLSNYAGTKRPVDIRGPPRKTEEEARSDADKLTAASVRGPGDVRKLANGLHRG
ncbi:unnamed protein product [Prorocentrum cordatum]|uniref:Uncharacterized protein n=1 Tax=Prorocentrum cordatum TaxID=2364126 RepID=A0ABN9T4F2_9DINO|nr:unnamed protein product [Polarella glacialis]